MANKYLLFVLFVSTNLWNNLNANIPIRIETSLRWYRQSQTLEQGNRSYEYYTFEGALYNEKTPTLPHAQVEVPLSEFGELRVRILRAEFEDFNMAPLPSDVQYLTTDLDFRSTVEKDRNRFFGKIHFIPIVKTGNRYRRLTYLELEVDLQPKAIVDLRTPNDVRTSTLSSGEIYKIAVTEAGIHKLSFDFLKDELNIDVDAIDPRHLKILGDRGGMLPTNPAADRPEDVLEHRIFVAGEADGNFDPGDYLLFYAEGPDKWTFDPSSKTFDLQKNTYELKNYYFLKIDPTPGQRVQMRNSLPTTGFTTDVFDDFGRYEEERVNLLYQWGLREGNSQGSGRQWFGDHFDNERRYEYPDLFEFTGLATEHPVKISARMVLRALNQSSFQLRVNDQSFTSPLASRVSVLVGGRAIEVDYAKPALLQTQTTVNSDKLSFTVTYPNQSEGSEAWLDYLQVQVRRNLDLDDDQLTFRNVESIDYPSTTFNIGNTPTNTVVWDITDFRAAIVQEVQIANNTMSFGVATEVLREFVIFDPSKALLTPEAIGRIDNQNLHGIDNVDMIVIYHPEFESEATRFTEHRAEQSNLSIAAVTVDQVLNEFASGAKDPTAIRDFAKMLYDRNDRFRYVMLFGDGSFDSRNLYGHGGDFIPTFQNYALNPLFAFPSDDYFAILEPSNSSEPLSGRLNVAVGRLPVKTIEEANSIVSKIINYDKNPETYSDWRNRLLFVGDDEDGNEHVIFADRIANDLSEMHSSFNVDKIYLDAFPQVATPGGQRFPAVTEAINNSVFKGTLVVTYLGHGGPNGWAQERILNSSDINAWTNSNRLPIFLTATCSFAGYDDPSFTSAGEEVILNPRGGAVALLTTTRAVYSSQNADLTRKALEELFKRENGKVRTIGEAMSSAKNRITNSSFSENSRKFTLLGDPSQQLAIPEYSVKTLSINGRSISENAQDTLRALQKVTVEGVVLDESGAVFENFNGIIFPTIFDKKIKASTLGQDSRSLVREFTIQKNVLFNGRATLKNGRFSFTFVVPKDINYQFGPGKISYYGSDKNQLIDAAGNFDQIIIGGASEELVTDDQGPEINVFMNTEDFVFGGITDENPVLLVKLEDENGINVVGNSIGHDLEGTLDEDSQNTLLLNDFYESEVDDYTRGEVRFPLSNLEEGLHTMKVKAWDVANNSSEGYTEFVVANSAELALKHVLNYPNPFLDHTCFQFDHNGANQEIEILVQIFTVSGRLVKTLREIIFSDGALRQDDCLEWDGRDDYGSRLGRGVYLYKIKVRTLGPTPLSQESDFEKLVILK